tara:strand:+ start:245 stop:421 length:177 start_codon:yes stop_codon:yes gene_type:complete
MEDIDDITIIRNKKEFIKWNIKDLEEYKMKLLMEIEEIEKLINKKQSISIDAENLFKK